MKKTNTQHTDGECDEYIGSLINADIEESLARHYRYWKASRLPIGERCKAKAAKPKSSQRQGT